MAAVVAGTPRRVKSLLSSFLHSSDTQEEKSEQKEGSNQAPSTMCQPRSKEAFWNRVETFSPFTWFAKPMELSPLQCALYGWENTDVDILQCVSCKACLDATMATNWDPDMFVKTCEQLKDSLVAGHSKFCPWPGNPCPDAFLKLPVYTSTQWKEDFATRWQSVMTLGTNLPLLDTLTYKEMDEVTEDHIEELQKLVQSTGCTVNAEVDDMEQAVKAACLITLCGWKYRSSDSDADGHTLFCTMCRREIGLWNFRSISVDPDEDEKSVDEGEQLQEPTVTLELMSVSEDKSKENTSTAGSDRENLDDSMSVEVTGHEGSSGRVEHLPSFLGCKRTRNVQSSKRENERGSDVEDESMDMGIEVKLKLGEQEDVGRGDKRSALVGQNPFERVGDQSDGQELKIPDCPMVMEEPQARESTSKELLYVPMTSLPGRNSPVAGRFCCGSDVFSFRSPLHHSLSDLSDKEHCESLCVEVEEESLTEKLKAVESELEFMTGGTDTSAERDDYAPERKRIRLEDMEKTRFNPLSEHRSWCPWVTCGMTERERVGVQEPGTGWRMLLHTVLPSLFSGRVHSFVETPPQEAWKSVRKLLNECSSPASSGTTPGNSK